MKLSQDLPLKLKDSDYGYESLWTLKTQNAL